MTIPQALQLATQRYQAGLPAEVETICRQVLAVDPRQADALHFIGLAALSSGKAEEAAEWIRKAIAVNPSVADFHYSLGNTLRGLGRLDEAISALENALNIRPDLAVIHTNLGCAFLEKGRLNEAITAFQRTIQIDPGMAAAYCNLGSALLRSCRYNEALDTLRHALDLQPDLAETHDNLGCTLHALRRLKEAIAAHRKAIRLQPGYALAHNNLGTALRDQGELDEAAVCFRRACELQPTFAAACLNLGNVLKEQGRLDEAVAAYHRALQLHPDLATAHNNLGTLLKEQGCSEEALSCFRHALQSQPDSAGIRSNFIETLHYVPGTTLRTIFEEHCEYDRRHAAPLLASAARHDLTDRPHRLRLGFVSPHFADHPVGRFLIRLLENLDRDEFDIVCYSDTPAADEMTARIRAAATEWHEVRPLSDEDLARRIREERITILFDLAGHTAGDRLLVFARKPAPIQITWLDYVGTTGLGAIDYIIADPQEIPTGAEDCYREQVLRMPHDYICYDPPAIAPPVNPLPALTRGSITFGSFNILPKTSPQVIAVWARILQRLPDARLVMKNRGLDNSCTVTRYRQLFAGHGIPAERVEFLGWSPPDTVLACYHEIDIALDTFPYNGGLTTCEALWMGVPVVTFPGETFASRHGLAHLTAAGCTSTIARDIDDYAEIAVALAGDIPRLAAIRAKLREQVAVSPLCNGRQFADHFGMLMREVWKKRIQQEEKPA